MEKLTTVVALVASVVSVIIAIYNAVFKNGQKRRDKYYEVLLRPFLVVYKNNSDVDAIDFLKPILKYDNDNVPKYIFKLYDEKDTVRIKKVLLYDYYALYKNEDNSKARILDSF